jgi:phosphohistidine phosphatase SixA
MPMLKVNQLLVLFAAGFLLSTLAGCAAQMSHSKPGTETTIILTRHAEKTAITDQLTEKGRARAQTLAKLLRDKKITAIFSPDITRNLDTARPLAKNMKIDITVVSSKPYPDKIVEAILAEHSGGVVLWVGNTSNLSEIYSQLGGKGEAPDNYGDLFIMKIKDQGAPEVVKSRYEAH